MWLYSNTYEEWCHYRNIGIVHKVCVLREFPKCIFGTMNNPNGVHRSVRMCVFACVRKYVRCSVCVWGCVCVSIQIQGGHRIVRRERDSSSQPEPVWQPGVATQESHGSTPGHGHQDHDRLGHRDRQVPDQNPSPLIGLCHTKHTNTTESIGRRQCVLVDGWFMLHVYTSKAEYITGLDVGVYSNPLSSCVR